MAALTPEGIVAAWERGRSLPDWAKALAALEPAGVADGACDASSLTVGERNARLLALRRDTIGPTMRAFVKCPACGEPLEFEQSIAELLDGYAPPSERRLAIEIDGYVVHCRLLDSRDVAAATELFFEDDVREALVDRAVDRATRDGAVVAVSALPASVRIHIAETMWRRDPLAQMTIALSCASCTHVWQAPLDIVAFLWTEIERTARAILDDVVQLARGYGWREEDILAMSAQRRQFYLEAMA